ncbi:hypothetical protein PMIN06_012981 [Paraphaeosphaeria minitans]
MAPYTSGPVALRIGPENKTYYVPQDYLKSLDSITSCRSWDGYIHLPDVDESTGHVLVHYLHTGLDQTLNGNEMSLVPVAITEFKRAVLAYTAANKYGLFDLQQLAKHKIECFGAEINIFDVVEAIKGGKATAAFEEDHTVFAGDNFFDRIDDVTLAKVMAKCVVELYNNKVSRMHNTEKEPVPGVSEECTPDIQDSSVEEAQVQEAFTIENTPAEECSAPDLSTEQYPTQDYPISDLPVEESTIQEASIEEHATAEECPPETNEWGFFLGNAIGKKKSKKGKKCAIEEMEDEPKVDELPIPAVEPVLSADNDWGTFTIGSKMGKNGKKGAIEEIEDEPKSDELPIPAPEPAPPADDDWGTFAFGSTKGKKKKSKKCAKGPGIEEPSPPPPEPEPEPALAEEMKDDGWDSWTLQEPTVEPLAPKAVAEEKQAEDWSNYTSKGVEEVAVPEPEPEPVNGKDEGGERGFSSKWDRRVNKKKGKSAEPKPAPVVDAMTIMQKTDGTVVGTGNTDRRAELDQPIEDDGEICPVRAKHLLGDEWKNCRQCRVMLRQVAIQLARADPADEDGYMVVDQVLMK